MTAVAHAAFISGLNTILVVSAIVLFVGAILAFLLVRQQDFVASGPERPRARLGRSASRGAATREARSRSASCHDAMRSITAAPVTMTSACAAIENATASAVPTPPSTRIAAPAPAWVAAPAGAIGRAAEAAEATRNASAST